MNDNARSWAGTAAFRRHAVAGFILVACVVAGLRLTAQTQGLLREVYTGIPGVDLSQLTNHAKFPSQPDKTGNILDFEAPIDVADDYGQRVRGYIIPPVTGNYTFWIASDDSSSLFLSTDDSTSNRRLIASVTSWTSSREWGKEINQKSAAIPLQADRPYYIEALMKEGGGGDNLAVRWQLPSGAIEEPIPRQRLLPFGVTFTAPQIEVEPLDTTGVEGGVAAFSVKLKGVSPARFLWLRNGTAIAAATNGTYFRGPLSLDDHQSNYRCAITNTLGFAITRLATLSVSPDTTPPIVVDVINTSATTVRLVFSEPMQAASANTVGSYAISPATSISSAVLGSDQRTVVLNCAPLVMGQEYTVSILNAFDLARTPNRIASDTRATFTAVDYVLGSVGEATGGSAKPALGGLDLAGIGLGVEAGSDQFQFGYQICTGDFDIQVRLEAFTPSNPWAQAGLMARESLGADSRFAAVFATPAAVGSFFMSRGTAGGAAATSGNFPVNFPQTWLRLKRVGSLFRGYGSWDGITWTSLGFGSVAISSSVYFGPALASRDVLVSATALFRNIGPVVSLTESAVVFAMEPTGPSNRKTGLVVSEIMYHPLARQDGRDVEFLEVFNAGNVWQDLTGHRVSGDVDFAFPAGTRIPAGGFLVVAKVPADLEAVAGMRGVMGPYAGRLSNGGGNLRLRNEVGTFLWATKFSTQQPWPLAADGAGHSLVLSRPSYGEGDSRAWSASARRGGSPGGMETVIRRPLAGLVINEFLAHVEVASQEFVELFNTTSQPMDISGCVLTDDPAVKRFVIPFGTILPPRGFVTFDREHLGFGLTALGETLILLDPSTVAVLDIVSFGGQAKGISVGRTPDGQDEFKSLVGLTPGAVNAKAGMPEIVINEIMYHPLSGEADDEYVELFNRSSSSVDLSGWAFIEGIDFTFPAGFAIPGNGYTVVARNVDRLKSSYPTLSPTVVAGSFSGSLSGSGERLALARPERVVSVSPTGGLTTHVTQVIVDEVAYGTGGRWGRWADGGGSSLERLDPRGESQAASNWADSDESNKAGWSTIQFTGVLDNGRADYPSDFQMHLLGMGECLVDDVEVISTGGANLVSNGGFENGVTGWAVAGNHRTSRVEIGSGIGGGRALRVISSGRGDTGANRIQSLLPNKATLVPGTVATLRAKVRWLGGFPEFLLRLRGNWLEAAGPMVVPKNLGSPGARNTRWVANAGPTLAEVSHSPVLPAANQNVAVTVRVRDVDGIASVVLKYRQDPANTLSSVTMVDTGSGVDAVAGDGIYSATIPGRAAGSLVAFHITATDGAALAASSRFPNSGIQECLIRWGESPVTGDFGVYRMWQGSTNASFLSSREPLANDPIDATFVYGNSRVIYNMSMRGKGSPFHGGSIGSDYVFSFPKDDLFLGESDLALVTVGNLGSDSSAQREQTAFWIGRELGVPYLHRRYVHFYNNGNKQGLIYEDAQEPNGEFVGALFPDSSDGDLHKIEDWFEFADDSRSFVNTDATLQKFTTTGGALKLARYRWDWRKRAVKDSASNFTNLFNLVNAVNTVGLTYTAQVENLLDVDEWMRTFALQHIVGNWDAYGHGRGKNSYLYKPDNSRWVVIPWDIDFVLGLQSDSTSADIFGTNDPTISRMYGHPPFLRAYWRAIRDACDGPLLAERVGPVLDARYQSLLKNSVNVTSPQDIKDWIDVRRSYLLGRLAAVDGSFSIISNAGQPFSTSDPVVTLTGSAPVVVRTIRINGMEYPATWTSVTGWRIQMGLSAGVNVFAIEGLDIRGRLISGAVGRIEITYTGASVDPGTFVLINEIHYNPIEPGTSFVEIYNRSASSSFDLSGCELQGLGFRFPGGTWIGPGSFLVVVANNADFAAQYGFGILPAGEFTGNLDNGGETIRLVKPGATPDLDQVLDEVRYDNNPPWPTVADGQGPSLQLIDPNQDNSRPGNWASAGASSPLRTTPGSANSVRAVLSRFPTIWLNEISPRGLSGFKDASGESAPWVELYNSGSSPVDLTGLFLSDSDIALTRWQFPAGSSIAAGGFRVLWLDGHSAESGATEWHAGFRVAPSSSGGQLFLSRIQAGTPAVVDSLRYGVIAAERTYGSLPDGQSFLRREMHIPTPGTVNNGALPRIAVFVNEWLASNSKTLADPADAQFEDWFELFNDGPTDVDLSGYYLTDTSLDKAKFQIPAGWRIPAGGYLLVWADEETSQNSLGGDLHVNFKLSATGEEIGLFGPYGSVVDSIQFGPQTVDVSQGRSPDGYSGPFIFMTNPGPGTRNPPNVSLGWPSLDAVAGATVNEGETVEFVLRGVSHDNPPRPLSYSLIGAPSGAEVHPQTGRFHWSTTEAHGPGAFRFQARVSDDAQPVRWASVFVNIDVREVNTAPILEPIQDIEINEGQLFTLAPQVVDPDEPRNHFVFSLGPGAPAGMSVNESSGILRWTPSEQQGGANYPVTVIVSDSAPGIAPASAAFRINVLKVENAPVFDPLGTITVDEGAATVITAHAVDPDLAGTTLNYSLQLGAPAGMAIDSATGKISWTPSETQGPGSYNVEVRATEPGETGLSSSIQFSIIVREVNQAPTLSAPDYLEIPEGEILDVRILAADGDLPRQRITFRLQAGAPSGMTIDAASGVLHWPTDVEAGSSTNRIAVEAVDDGFPPMSAASTLTVVVRGRERLAINEFLLGSGAGTLQFIELHNASQNPRDVSGLRLDPTGFLFPQGTLITPGGFLVVANDAPLFRTRFGADVSLAGTFGIPLPLIGGILRLVRPSATSHTGEVLDEVEYENGGAWPKDRLGVGASFQLIDPAQDNSPPANWSMVQATGSGVAVTSVALTSSWHYLQPSERPPDSWILAGFDDSSWPIGGGLFYVENADLAAPKTTPLTLGKMTYYFRTQFVHEGPVAETTLRLGTMLDDGAVVYLNGAELFRLGIGSDPVDGSTPANRLVPDAIFEGGFEFDSSRLLPGLNQLAVEVHQVNSGSTDVVFGMQLETHTPHRDLATPGWTNSVNSVLPPFPKVRLARLARNGSNGVKDSAGDEDPWVELLNEGATPASLSGLYLSNRPDDPARFALPGGMILAPGERRLIWCDAELAEGGPGEIHTPFRPLAGPAPLVLLRFQGDRFVVLSQSKDLTFLLTLAGGEARGKKGQEIVVPVLVTSGFENLTRLQVNVFWDPAMASFQGLEGSGMTGWSSGQMASSGVVLVDWAVPSSEISRSVAAGGKLFGLRFLVVTSVAGTMPVTFVAPAEGSAVLSLVAGMESPVTLVAVAGHLQIDASDRLRGEIRYFKGNQPVAAAQVQLSAIVGGLSQSATADNLGAFGFDLNGNGAYRLNPVAGPIELPANGVTTIDILTIRRHVIGSAQITSPYGLIAADAGGNRSISTLDIVLIRRLILGITSDLPGGRWKFIPSDHLFATPSNPWTFPSDRPFQTGVNSLDGQDFIALKVGDANGSWTAQSPPPPPFHEEGLSAGRASSPSRLTEQGGDVVLELGGVETRSGDELSLPLITRGFEGVTSVQFTLEWNSSLFELVAVEELNLPYLELQHFGMHAAARGWLSFSWDDPSLNGVSTPDGTKVVKLRFRAISTKPSASLLKFSERPTPLEVSRYGSLTRAGTRPALLWTGAASLDRQRLLSKIDGSRLLFKTPTWLGLSGVMETTQDLFRPGAWEPLMSFEGTGEELVWEAPSLGESHRYYRIRYPEMIRATNPF